MTEQQEVGPDPSATAEPGATPKGLARFGMRRRVALGAVALLGPLLVVGAVGAADGDDPLDAPVEAVASAIGIGGNSGEQRNDYDNRSETAGDVGQPGSCPGKACEAPGHVEDGDAEEGDETSEAGPDDTSGAEVDDVETEKVDPHANGKGCDDVLFAGGEPPFGGHETPVGPCNEDGAAAGEEAADGVEEIGDTEGEGGESNGNGYGHEKGLGAGHETGLGEGHAKHGDGAGAATGEGAAPDSGEPGDEPGSRGKGKGKDK